MGVVSWRVCFRVDRILFGMMGFGLDCGLMGFGLDYGLMGLEWKDEVG